MANSERVYEDGSFADFEDKIKKYHGESCRISFPGASDKSPADFRLFEERVIAFLDPQQIGVSSGHTGDLEEANNNISYTCTLHRTKDPRVNLAKEETFYPDGTTKTNYILFPSRENF